MIIRRTRSWSNSRPRKNLSIYSYGNVTHFFSSLKTSRLVKQRYATYRILKSSSQVWRGGAIKKPPCMLFRYSLYQVPFTKPAKKMPLFYIGVDHYFSVCMFLSLEIHGKFRGTSWTIVMLIFVKHEPFNFQMATKHNSQASPSPPWGF